MTVAAARLPIKRSGSVQSSHAGFHCTYFPSTQFLKSESGSGASPRMSRSSLESPPHRSFPVRKSFHPLRTDTKPVPTDILTFAAGNLAAFDWQPLTGAQIHHEDIGISRLGAKLCFLNRCVRRFITLALEHRTADGFNIGWIRIVLQLRSIQSLCNHLAGESGTFKANPSDRVTRAEPR